MLNFFPPLKGTCLGSETPMPSPATPPPFFPPPMQRVEASHTLGGILSGADKNCRLVSA